MIVTSLSREVLIKTKIKRAKEGDLHSHHRAAFKWVSQNQNQTNNLPIRLLYRSQTTSSKTKTKTNSGNSGKKRQTHEVYQIFENFWPEITVLFDLSAEFTKFSVEWFTFRQHNNFPIFRKLSKEITICLLFESSAISGWMESALCLINSSCIWTSSITTAAWLILLPIWRCYFENEACLLSSLISMYTQFWVGNQIVTSEIRNSFLDFISIPFDYLLIS